MVLLLVRYFYGDFYKRSKIWLTCLQESVWARLHRCEKRPLASSFRLSVLPHGTTRLPLDVFWLNLILESFFFFRKSSETLQVSLKSEKSNGTLYVKTCSYLWKYLTESFLEWETFLKLYYLIFYNVFFFFPKIVPFVRWCWKNV